MKLESMKEEQKKALYRALHSYADAAGRWEERRDRGLTNPELRQAIAFEFGIEGAASGPEDFGGAFAHHVKGGHNPRLWIGTGYSCRTIDTDSPPTFEGEALLDVVREFLEIGRPGQPFLRQLSLF